MTLISLIQAMERANGRCRGLARGCFDRGTKCFFADLEATLGGLTAFPNALSGSLMHLMTTEI